MPKHELYQLQKLVGRLTVIFALVASLCVGLSVVWMFQTARIFQEVMGGGVLLTRHEIFLTAMAVLWALSVFAVARFWHVQFSKLEKRFMILLNSPEISEESSGELGPLVQELIWSSYNRGSSPHVETSPTMKVVHENQPQA